MLSLNDSNAVSSSKGLGRRAEFLAYEDAFATLPAIFKKNKGSQPFKLQAFRSYLDTKKWNLSKQNKLKMLPSKTN